MEKNTDKNKAPKKAGFSLKESFRRDKLSWLGTIGLGIVLIAVFTFTNQDLWRNEPPITEPLDIAHENLPEPGEDNPLPVINPQDSTTGQGEEDSQNTQIGEDASENPEALVVSAAPEVWLPPALGQWERTYGFGLDPTYEDYRLHSGLDMPLPLGELVFAVAGGTILKAQADPLWGGRVEIEHGGGYTSVYLGITPAGIKPGQKVQGGDTIGTVAPSPPAEKAQESHLHFELWLDGKTINPAEFF